MPSWTGCPGPVLVICWTWASLVRAPARLIWRPSTSPSHPSRRASSIRASRFSRISRRRWRWAGSGRSRGQLCSWLHGVPNALPQVPVATLQRMEGGTGNTSSAPATGPAGCPGLRPAAPCRSTRRRPRAACPTTGRRTTPAAAPDGTRPSGSWHQTARPPPGQDEPGQHVSLERRQLLRPGRRTRLTQIPHDRQAHPGPPRLHRSGKAIGPGDELSRNLKLPQMPGSGPITGEPPAPGTTQTTGTHGNSEVIY